MKKFLIVFVTVLFCSSIFNSFQSAAKSEIETLSKAGEEALKNKDYQKAIDLALPSAKALDAKAQFSIGIIILIWLDDKKSKDSSYYSFKEAMDWIYKAAGQDLSQAAEHIATNYERGRHSFPKDEDLEKCWRKVSLNQEKAKSCLAKEDKKFSGRPYQKS